MGGFFSATRLQGPAAQPVLPTATTAPATASSTFLRAPETTSVACSSSDPTTAAAAAAATDSSQRLHLTGDAHPCHSVSWSSEVQPILQSLLPPALDAAPGAPAHAPACVRPLRCRRWLGSDPSRTGGRRWRRGKCRGEGRAPRGSQRFGSGESWQFFPVAAREHAQSCISDAAAAAAAAARALLSASAAATAGPAGGGAAAGAYADRQALPTSRAVRSRH